MTGALAVMPPYVGNERADTTSLRVSLAAVLAEEERKRRIAYSIEQGMVRRGMTPPQLATKIGRSRGTVNDWVAGRSTPSLVDLGPLCAALRLDPRLFAELPPIPADPLEGYLLETADEAVATGIRRARRRRAPAAPSTPPPSDEQPPRGSRRVRG